MTIPPPLQSALTALRDALAFYQATPSHATTSMEIEDSTRAAAWAGITGRVPFPAVCAELGRAATEVLSQDPLAAIAVGRTMTRWAAEVYHYHASRGTAAS